MNKSRETSMKGMTMRNILPPLTTVMASAFVAGVAYAQGGPSTSAQMGPAAASTEIVTFGAAKFGLPRAVSIIPSALKAKPGVITSLPSRNAKLKEGDVVLSASGRPVFVLRGDSPIYRDLAPGISGSDVRQLEAALARLNFDPGPVDGRYDAKTGLAVSKWYVAAGWEPFGPTPAQRANLRSLQAALSGAVKTELAAAAAATAAELTVKTAKFASEQARNVAAADIAARAAARDKAVADLANATLAVKAARAVADHKLRVANADRSAKFADRRQLVATEERGTPLAVEAAIASAEHANKAAKADIAAKSAERALVVLDPRSSNFARAAAEAQLQLARAAAAKIELESQVAIQAARRSAKLVAEQIALAEAAVKAAKLEGDVAVGAALNARKAAERDVSMAKRQLVLAGTAAEVRRLERQAAIRAAVDAQKIAELDLQQASEQAARAAADLETAKNRTGVQAPTDEIVFLPTLPVRVEQASVLVGDPASGAVLAVTQVGVTIDSSAAIEVAKRLKVGMKVEIAANDGLTNGTIHHGSIDRIAPRPGTDGVDRGQVYFRVRIADGAELLPVGTQLRLMIQAVRTGAKSTDMSSKQSSTTREPDSGGARKPRTH